jgi:inosine/xanthosine triphosphatase
MKIFVGSTNPVKVNAVTVAAAETWPEGEVTGFEVESGVSEQPRSDQETKQGAINRAKHALRLGQKQVEDKSEIGQQLLGLGLEGGIFIKDDEMWSTVWGAVVDQQGRVFLSNGARFQVPPMIAGLIRQGREMGPVMAELFKGREIKKQEGMIGIITKKFVDRTEEYSSIAKMCLGLWYGRDWQDQLLIKQ